MRAAESTSPPPRLRFTDRSAVTAMFALVLATACTESAFDLAGGSMARTFDSDALVPAHAFAATPRDAAEPVEHAGLLYSAEVVAVRLQPHQAPTSLMVVAWVRNPSASPVSLTVNGCTVWPEFHAPGKSVTGDPVWTPQGQCGQAPYTVVLQPGGEHAFEFLAHDAMLAHGLEDGRYDVIARVNLPDITLRLDAGTADVRLMVLNLRFHVRVDEDNGRPAARIRIENRNPDAVYLEWGHCAVGFELHAAADLSDAPQHIERERLCMDYLATTTVAPGAELEAKEFSYSPASHSGRNPELRPGTYQLVVRLDLNGRSYRFPMGSLTVR
jgi:hypothetical protein